MQSPHPTHSHAPSGVQAFSPSHKRIANWRARVHATLDVCFSSSLAIWQLSHCVGWDVETLQNKKRVPNNIIVPPMQNTQSRTQVGRCCLFKRSAHSAGPASETPNPDSPLPKFCVVQRHEIQGVTLANFFSDSWPCGFSVSGTLPKFCVV